MDIKVVCDCGQRYAFDIEPLNGRMPIEVACPSCNAGGTERANAIIASRLSEVATPPPPPVASPGARITLSRSQTSPVPGPPPPTVKQPASTPPVAAQSPAAPTSPPRLRVGRAPTAESHSTPPPPVESLSSDAAAVMSATAPPPVLPTAKKRKIEKVFGEPNMRKTIIGACIGASLMTAIWFGLWKGTHGTWGIMAVGVGWMAGFFARLIGRSEGNQMGLVTMGIALAFIFGFQFYRAFSEMPAETDKIDLHMNQKEVDALFDEEVKKSKEIVKAIPNGTDAEIRAYMAGKEGNPANPQDIPADDVKVFRVVELKIAQDYASGKTTRESYRADFKKTADQMQKMVDAPSRIIFWIRAFGVLSIVSIAGGAFMAFRFGSGEG